MQDKELYEQLLGLKAPWRVSAVDLQMAESKVSVSLTHDPLIRFPCPECGLESPTHDHRHRQWRHLDTCGFVTMVEADIPRVDCPSHGVRQAKVPWAEPGSGFTALFEALAISWLKVASTKAVSDRMKISWDETWGIMERAVRRGLARRDAAPIEELAIDETSFQKRHEYVTVLVDRKNGVIVDILDDRKKVTLKKWLAANKDQLREVRSVSMDMWEPFITAVQESIEGADSKICFDRFHVAAHFGKALDKVRATEHRTLGREGDSPLTKTKHDWLRTKANGGYKDKRAFLRLTRQNLKTARAWRIKEAASGLWSYTYRGAAERNWKALLGWIARCRLESVIKVGNMIRRNLWGILNAIMHKATNAIAESINAVIQKIKARACGFRNRARFRTAILFQKGGLSMLPSGASGY
ncbi:MAG: ISL3 family transposase [Spirochaetes bacterium]|nr:ISL3 family transposase [Spirochaetota bacterium]